MPGRRRLARRRATCSPRRARSCAASWRGWPSAAGARTRAPSSSSWSSSTPTSRPGTRATASCEPANLYNVDYSLLGHRPRGAADPAHPQRAWRPRAWWSRTPRASATSASTRSTSATPTRCAPPTSTSIYKNGAKEIAAAGGDGDHVHGQVRPARGQLLPHPLLARRRAGRRCSRASAALFESFLAGQLACLREMTLLLAPNVNSYKRFAAGTLRARRRSPGATTTAPARCGWSAHGPALRFENRVGGADLNPYLALSAHHRLGPARRRRRACELEPAFEGNAYAGRRAPARAAHAARRARAVRRQRGRARGLRRGGASPTTSTPPTSSSTAFGAAVTDWERVRGFERL